MKYTFTFKEINYGSIEIESDHEPDRGNVIDAIMNGGAYFDNTDYEGIALVADKTLDISADGKSEKEIVQGYEIKQISIFKDNRGFALAKDSDAPDPFVTWQFTQDDSGARDYYWGHYFSSEHTATKDFSNRVIDHMRSFRAEENTVYRYYSTQRPVDIGTFPKPNAAPLEIMNFNTRAPVEDGSFLAWGYIDYAEPLTKKQADDYELRPAANNPDPRRIEEQAQVVGKWEQAHHVNMDKQLTFWDSDIGMFVKYKSITPKHLAERYEQIMETKARATEKRNSQKPIAEQLAEAAKMVERDETSKTDKKQNKSHEDR